MQWLLSGDFCWFELVDDFVKYVVDIDVYYISDDKFEYSGGLFWYIDYYVQVYIVFYRMYFKYQLFGVYDDYVGGGGLGG